MTNNNQPLTINNGQLIDGSVDAIGVPNAGTSESNVESVFKFVRTFF